MKNHFDEVARQWDQNKVHLERTRAIADAVLQEGLLIPGSRGLEFGAGTALLSIVLNEHFREIVLVDSSAEMLKVTAEKLSREELHHLHPRLMDIEKGDPEAGSYDVVFSQMALHHIRDIGALLPVLHQMLNPGGRLIIADLYPEDGSFHDHQDYVHQGIDPEVLSQGLQNHGFSGVAYRECYRIRRENESGIKEFPVFLLWAQKQA